MPLSFDALRAKLREVEAAAPQRLWNALEALGAVEAGLDGLRSLGHNFSLIDAEVAPIDEFPKMYYSTGGETLVVHSAEAAAALSPGWYDHPNLGVEPEAPAVAPAEPLLAPVSIDIAAAIAAGTVILEKPVAAVPFNPEETPKA